MKVTLENLGFNDIKGALAIARRAMRTGKWGPELAEILANKQDDPGEFFDELKRLAKQEGTK